MSFCQNMTTHLSGMAQVLYPSLLHVYVPKSASQETREGNIGVFVNTFLNEYEHLENALFLVLHIYLIASNYSGLLWLLVNIFNKCPVEIWLEACKLPPVRCHEHSGWTWSCCQVQSDYVMSQFLNEALPLGIKSQVISFSIKAMSYFIQLWTNFFKCVIVLPKQPCQCVCVFWTRGENVIPNFSAWCRKSWWYN